MFLQNNVSSSYYKPNKNNKNKYYVVLEIPTDVTKYRYCQFG